MGLRNVITINESEHCEPVQNHSTKCKWSNNYFDRIERINKYQLKRDVHNYVTWATQLTLTRDFNLT